MAKNLSPLHFLLSFGISILLAACASVPEPAKPVITAPAAAPVAPPIDVKRVEDVKITTLEMQKYAYELGFDPKKEIPNEQKLQILERKKLRELERSLDTQKERRRGRLRYADDDERRVR